MGLLQNAEIKDLTLSGSYPRIREYIRLNPVQWEMDEENPDNIQKR